MIDAPPHAETEARIAVRAARLVVVPVQPSPLDLWATAETMKMARDERRRSLVVLKPVPPRSRLNEDIAADLAGAGIPIAATWIGNRVALAQAMALGLGVIEIARMTPTAAELSALAEEIRGGLSGQTRGWSPRQAQLSSNGMPRFLLARNRQFESFSLQRRVTIPTPSSASIRICS